MGGTYRRTNITATLHQSGIDRKVTKLKLLLSKDTWSMVAAASCSGGVFQRHGLGKWSEKMESWMQLNTEISIMKTWFRVLRTVWKFTFQHDTQPRQCRSGLESTLWTSSSGPARSQSDIFGETYKWLSTVGPQPTWQSFRWSKEKNGNKTNADVPSLLHYTEKYPRL